MLEAKKILEVTVRTDHCGFLVGRLVFLIDEFLVPGLGISRLYVDGAMQVLLLCCCLLFFLRVWCTRYF